MAPRAVSTRTSRTRVALSGHCFCKTLVPLESDAVNWRLKHFRPKHISVLESVWTLLPLARAVETEGNLWSRTLTASLAQGPTGPLAAVQRQPEDSLTAPPGRGPACLAKDQRDRALLLSALILSTPCQQDFWVLQIQAGMPNLPPPQSWGAWPLVLSLAIEMRCRPRPWLLWNLLPAGASLLLV